MRDSEGRRHKQLVKGHDDLRPRNWDETRQPFLWKIWGRWSWRRWKMGEPKVAWALIKTMREIPIQLYKHKPHIHFIYPVICLIFHWRRRVSWCLHLFGGTKAFRGKMQWCSSYFVCWTTFLRTRPWWACRWCKVIWHAHLQCWYKRNDVMQSMKGIWVLLNTIYPSHMDHDGIAVLLMPFNSVLFFASTRHNSRRIPSHHNFDFELSRWCHCHLKQEWHALWRSVDLSYVMRCHEWCPTCPTCATCCLLKKMLPWKLRWAIPSKMVPIPEDMLNIVKLLVIQGFVSVATSCSSSRNCGMGLGHWDFGRDPGGFRQHWWCSSEARVAKRELRKRPCSTRDLQVCCSKYGFPGPWWFWWDSFRWYWY